MVATLEYKRTEPIEAEAYASPLICTYSDTLVTVEVHTPDPGEAHKNQYMFCHNNPVMYVDHTGQDPVTVTLGTALVIAGKWIGGIAVSWFTGWKMGKAVVAHREAHEIARRYRQNECSEGRLGSQRFEEAFREAKPRMRTIIENAPSTMFQGRPVSVPLSSTDVLEGTINMGLEAINQ